MGSGASTAALEEFGPAGNIDAVRHLCDKVGREFSQPMFDGLKVMSLFCKKKLEKYIV
jgi:hypothetical protein